MSSEFISKIIKKDINNNISDMFTTAYSFINKQLDNKSKLDIIKEILDRNMISFSDKYMIISWNPFNVLIYDYASSINLDEYNNCFQLPLTDNNFSLIVKNAILNEILNIVELPNFEPDMYNLFLNVL